MEQNYCRRCGSPLTQHNEVAFICANQHAIYSNPAPCVGIFLFDQQKRLMLSVRGIEPNKGMLDSIGGFIDLNESIEQGLSREIAEETGMDASQYSTPTYFASAHGSYVHDGETRSVLSSFYFATMNTNANPVASDDVAAFEYVDLPTFDRTRIGNTDVLAVIDDLLTATA